MNLAAGSNRVAIFIPDFSGGGAERVMLRYACWLIQRGVSVDILVVRKAGELIDLVPEQANIHCFDKSSPWLCILPLASYLKRNDVTLFATLFQINIIAVLAGLLSGRVRKVIIREANTFSIETRKMKLLKRLVIRLLVFSLYRMADHVIAVSQGVKDDLVRYCSNPEKITVIYNPVRSVNPDKLNSACREMDALKNHGQKKLIFGIGRLSYQKDFDTLISAFAQLRSRVDARLLLFGSGPALDQLKAHAGELEVGEDVCFMGYREDVLECLMQADLFVLSSRYEGCPNALLEAVAYGIPSVSTDCPSGPKELLPDNQKDFLVSVGCSTEMSQAMEGCLAIYKNGARAESQVSKYSADILFEKYYQLAS